MPSEYVGYIGKHGLQQLPSCTAQTHPPKLVLLDPKAGTLDPKAGVLVAPNKLPPELFEPNKLLLELAPKKPGLLLAPKPPSEHNHSNHSTCMHKIAGLLKAAS